MKYKNRAVQRGKKLLPECKSESIGVEKIGGLYYVVCHCKVLRCQTVKGFKTENEAVAFWNSDK